MDPELMQNVKKFFHVGTVYKELVDPYCVINFAGIKGKTRTIQHEQDPEWNQQLNLNVKASYGAQIRASVVNPEMGMLHCLSLLAICL